MGLADIVEVKARGALAAVALRAGLTVCGGTGDAVIWVVLGKSVAWTAALAGV